MGLLSGPSAHVRCSQAEHLVAIAYAFSHFGYPGGKLHEESPRKIKGVCQSDTGLQVALCNWGSRKRLGGTLLGKNRRGKWRFFLSDFLP
jgi:hypothetical protein